METRQEFALELAKAARIWRARLDDRLKQTGLTQARWIALMHLSLSGGGLSQRALAELIGVEGPTLGRCLDALEAQGLIERRPDNQDRRVNIVHLTESAGPILDEINGIAAELRHAVLAAIPTHDLLTCLDVFGRIQQVLRDGSSVDTKEKP